ncbi:MAG TPA: sodium/solute symporter [Ignavibacteriaceae bacterium]|nr:sodium/solute symporter [Ignavibacteriaceae bacterium]
MRISTVDYATIIIYLAGIVCLGIWVGFRRRKGGEGSHYFLAGNTLTWPVIGLAMFAANISTVHLVSLAESAYKYGLIYGNFEWMAGFTLILLSLFFAPLYLRSRVPTLPDYLERRFNRNCRDWLAVISIISAIVIHIGVALYTAAWVLRGIMGISTESTILGINSLMFFILVLGILTGIYTMVGGLLAVVMTESVQTILLLVGAVVITVVGFIKIGGWETLTQTLQTQPHPMEKIPGSGINWGTSNFLNMLRASDDPSGLPWYSILLGYPVLGIWYWCCDQTIVQRVLAAKDEKQARLGPLFCAFLKILPVFFFVLPGIICVALVQNNYFGGEAPQSAADTYTFMITHMLPVGLKGLIAAAMLAAAMQTCSAALNSTATLFSYDIVKRWKPLISDHNLVVIGKITTIAATIIAIILSPIFGHYSTIIEGLNKLISYIAPPITAVFLFGVFWKKASGKAAFITLTSGAVLGLVIFYLDWNGIFVSNFMMTAFYLLLLCCLIMIISSYVFPEPLKEEAKILVWENWKEPLKGEAKGFALGNYKVLSAIVFITFIVLYYIFR